MCVLVKLVLVAFGLFGQTQLFPENPVSTESALDSVYLPTDKPELVLAKRAMAAEGLCPTELERISFAALDKGSAEGVAGSEAKGGVKEIASICF